MQFDKMFPTKYLKGEDFLPSGKPVTITSAILETMPATAFASSATKPVLYVQEFTKGIVLSRQLASKISHILNSDDTDRWIGGKVYLYPVMVDTGDHPHLVIRAAVPLTQRTSSNQAEVTNTNSPRYDPDNGLPPARSLV